MPRGRDDEKLRLRIRHNRGSLFLFITDQDMLATDTGSGRQLRPSVIFRKAANGFCADWSAQTYAAFRSIVATAKRAGITVLDAIRAALAGVRPGPV